MIASPLDLDVRWPRGEPRATVLPDRVVGRWRKGMAGPVPALGNKTPGEAFRIPEVRKLVVGPVSGRHGGRMTELPEDLRLAWLSDLHLEFVETQQVESLCRAIRAARPSHVLVGGDTGQARSVAAYLRTLAREVACPVFFVLGNHDFYGSGIATLEATLPQQIENETALRWLGNPDDETVVPLSPEVGLVGRGAWGDARVGAYDTTGVLLNDFVYIEEQAGLSRPALIECLRALGDRAAAHLMPRLEAALRRFPRVVVLTHVPPFVEACWHEGRISDADWLPFFVCHAVGEVLLSAAQARPDREILVLCGHTHGGGTARLAPNLEVCTAPAEYGAPGIARIITLPAARDAQ